MNSANIENKLNMGSKKTIRNILLVVIAWMLFVFVNYFFLKLKINYLFKQDLLYVYIYTGFICIAIFIIFWVLYKFMVFRTDKSKKLFFIFGILTPWLIYCALVMTFIYLAGRTFEHANFIL